MSHWKPSQSVGALKGDLDKRRERTLIACIAETGKKALSVVTVPTTAAAGEGDFFIYTALNGQKLGFWLNKNDAGNDAGSAPVGLLAAACDSLTEIDIVTGGTAIVNAALVFAELEAVMAAEDVTAVDNLDGTITLTEDLVGSGVTLVRKNLNESGNGAFGVASTDGAASVLQNKKMTILNSTTAFYAWFNVNGEGADPTGTGTGLEVALSPGTSGVTAAQVSAALAAILLAATGLFASADGSNVYASSDAEAPAVDAGAGNTGFTVTVVSQGQGAVVDAGGSPADFTNEPDLVS